ncbi:hypothetical protein CY34DRAFT_799843 [Suillus luteus UH-Slu-Lm8-n1]|uniref:Uncharacterized protein n=1 Tax=Suillus luteus UH-Slu-Lm8-n1 TaxID=930992 RepID=A0A0D0AZ69_9AGAM|nr:hypothetical protein CY34DRAFT_799843 [Suillus luteus UH-Slu-Lm8-n1]
MCSKHTDTDLKFNVAMSGIQLLLFFPSHIDPTLASLSRGDKSQPHPKTIFFMMVVMGASGSGETSV